MHREITATSHLLSSLNHEQAAAVTLGWGPALIIAGAGSGKTTVLTRRIAYLLSKLKQDPQSIMAVTFTNKAAAQMKRHVESLLEEKLTRQLSIGTFHSICARILRREIEAYQAPDGSRWGRNFVIYDEVDSLNIVKGVIAKLNLDEKLFVPRDIRQSISVAKNEGQSAIRFAQAAKGYRETRCAEIFSAYQMELAKCNALDFDDLILTVVELLRGVAEVRLKLNSWYRHLLIDEFQDTNKSQFEMVRLLALPYDHAPSADYWEGRSLMVVGDVDQSIYSWRKADFRIILGFQKDFPGSELIKLEENYRSTSTILEVANNIISNNVERIAKVLRCNRGRGDKVNCFIAADEIDEAYHVVQEIKQIADGSKGLSQCAVLYRTNAQSRAIEEILVRNHIPYSMVGATRFYDRQEIKDIIAYLKLTYNRQDGQSFLRIINQPRRGIGKTTLEKLAYYAERNSLTLLDACRQAGAIGGLSPKAASSLVEFAFMLERWQTLCSAVPVASLVEMVLNQSGYIAKLEEEVLGNDPLAQGRIENLQEFVGVAKEFEESADEPHLEAFLTRISLVSDLDAIEFSNETVKLMTLHSAKGLEFSNVFIMGLEDGLFPHFRSLNSPSALEEERRLMYVGVTRAADRLHLSYARRRIQFSGAFTGSTSYTIPSRFLKEIDINLLQGYYPDPETPRDVYERNDASDFRRRRDGYDADDDYEDQESYERERAGGYAVGKLKSANIGYARSGKNESRVSGSRTALSASAASVAIGAADPKQEPIEKLSPGDVVQHVKFGIGTLFQVIGGSGKELYNVDFQESGKRLLDPRFAKLIKLESNSTP